MAKGISLHIGINHVDPGHYQGWTGDLVACESDATDLEVVARRVGYQTNKLLSAQATRQSVKSAIRAAASELDAGDIFLLTYSGHGGQVPDLDGDETDGLDETWLLFDGQIIDDELFAQYGEFEAGVRILVLSDSCHSGTVTKSQVSIAERGAVNDPGSVRYRAMPPEVANRVYRANRNFYDSLQRAPSGGLVMRAGSTLRTTVRLLSGCQDNQLSLDGPFNGLFTGRLLQVWDDGNSPATWTYSKLHSEIVKTMPSTQTPNHFVVGPANASFDAERPFTI